jgi:hypothetical protein
MFGRQQGNLMPENPDRVYVYAFTDGTQVTFNDSMNIITRSINRGQFTEFVYTTDSMPASVISNNPVMVYHFGMPDSKWPGWPLDDRTPQAASAIVPPGLCSGSKRVCFSLTPPHAYNGTFCWQIITRPAAINSFHFQPSYIVLDPNNWRKVPGTNGEFVENGALFGNFPMGYTVIAENDIGRFQFQVSTACPAMDTVSFAKFSYVTDYSTLNIGTDRSICPGDSVVLDAGYGRDTYLWSTGDTTSNIWVKAPGTYWVYSTESGNCSLSDTVKVSYYYFTPVNLGPDRQICTGDSILLDAGPGRSWYEWSTGDSTQSIWVKQTGTYRVKVPDIHCILKDSALISTTVPPVVTNNPLAKDICTGESTNIVLSSSVPGTLFHWLPMLTSGTISGYSADSGLVINQTLINAGSTPGIVTYHITPKVGNCSGSTVDFPVTVNPGDSVKVSISGSLNNVCAGTPVSFTANPTNPGTTPFYQWKVNANNAGMNNAVFTYNPVNGDIVSCVLTSSNTVCTSNNPATSNPITMMVNPLLPVSVSIATPTDHVCAGTPVTLTATPTNPGPNPSYQWMVNGTNAGTNSPVFSYTPVNGDAVVCILTSDALCATGSPASSNPVIMMVDPLLPPEVTITASNNPVCGGIPVTFTATPANDGTSPSYQWKVNGINVGTSSSSYTYLPAPNDSIRCMMTSSIPCPVINPVSSGTITMQVASQPAVTFTACFDTLTTVNAKPFKLKGGIPLGGTYSGPGVTPENGIFNPAVAGTGVKTITYTYTNVALCSDARSAIVDVRSAAPFTCGNNLTDIRDNQHYATVQIGTQCWMAANLNYGTMISSSSHQRDNCLNEKYCYQDLPANCSLQGAA